MLLACGPSSYQPGERPTVIEPWTDDDPGEDPSWQLYTPSRILRLELEIPAESLAALRRAPREYVACRLRYHDEVHDEVAVRLKGETTFRTIDEKPSFKIDFDRFVPGRRFHGVEHLNLHNAAIDASFLAERLSYLVFRQAGLPAPRANHAVVTVNGVSFGLYSNVETEDETFLARWFADTTGNLYEGNKVDLLPGNEDRFDLETNQAVDDRSDLRALVAAIAGSSDESFVADVAPHLDIERFVAYSAHEAVTGHWDGYSLSRYNLSNFRLYHDPETGQFRFLPSSLDLALKPAYPPSLRHSWTSGPAPYLSPWQARGILFQRCLAAPACRAAYQRALDDAVAGFTALDPRTWALAIYWQILDEVHADQRKEYSDDVFEYNVDLVLDTIAHNQTL